MVCPQCQQSDIAVLEKRDIEGGVRRRRVCNSCQHRFTTYERVEIPQLVVLKRDGGREHYNEEKVKRGIEVSCKNRPVQPEQIENAVENVTRKLRQGDNEVVSTNQVGELVLEELLALDKIAYLRFVSVHRCFADVEAFKKEIQRINN